ncbi:MAG: Hint domain-containing protein [Rhodobacterales bacterium]|nr:Hint domain-containing protein [Rhodobacterales bacterium]
MADFTFNSIVFAGAAFNVAPVMAPPVNGPGVVDGTSGDDLIDLAYTGDPDGDMIDNNDATLAGAAGDDDVVLAGAGNDTVRGEAGNDEIYGGAGDDFLKGLGGNDTLMGEDGDDFLVGGEGVDEISGGSGNDYIYGGNAGDVVDGNTEGSDYDTLDLRENGPLRVVGQTVDADGDSTSGTIEFLDAAGNVTGTMTFAEIENLLLPDNPVNGDPVANDDTATTDEDTPVVIDVLTNDTDPNGDPLSISGTPTALHGTVTVNPDGTLEYTPDPDYYGDDVITYDVTDGNGGTSSGSVAVTVNPVNDDPVANDDTAATAFDTPVVIDVLANDTDVDGDTLAVLGTPTSPDGTVAVLPDGTIEFTPTPGFTGDATISYDVGDGNGGTDTGSVTVAVGTPAGRDGIVSGTAGDDLIDVAYAGDPDGDMIDNNDALLPGEAPNDDIVQAGDGNDTILSGEGSDDVYGGAGDDLIDTGNGVPPANDHATFQGVPVDADPDDDRDYVEGGAGNDTISTGDDADTIMGGEGADSILSGMDDDVVHGDAGDDYIDAGMGADYVDGGDGNDTIIAGFDAFSDYVGDDPILPTTGLNNPDGTPELSDPNVNDGMDTVYGGAGDDVIVTGDDADMIYGGDDNDTIDAGIDDDYVEGGTGDDSIIGGHGSDTIYGNDGDDFINAGDSTLLHGQAPDSTDPVPENGRDLVFGGAGNDTILGQDDDDTIDGGDGNDVIDGGLDDDILRGRMGDDTVTGGHGNDTITGGFGDDMLIGGDDSDAFADILDATDPEPDNGRDFLDGRQGDDTIFGGDDDDTLMGGTGNDLLDGGIDEDSIEGGAGDDTIIGGQGADTLFGEGGQDVFLGGNAGDVIDGGGNPGGTHANGLPNDYDTLDLRGSAPTGGRLEVTYTSADQEDGTVEYFDDTGASTGTLTFTEIENVIPCFTPGTVIATPKGERLVEELAEGDRIITRDNGIQEIRWIGAKPLTGTQLVQNPHLKPILVQAGSLGNGLPERDMLVSPNHRLLISNDKTALYFEEREVLAAAKHLTGMAGVDAVDAMGTTYIHFMFDQHEVVLSNGTWTESFQPGDQTLNGIGAAQRSEIFELFPELETMDGIDAYQSARRSLKKHEAKLLVK